MKWHPSQIGNLMTNGRGKNDIGATAISYIKKVAKENFYGYKTELNTKQIIKGKEQEQDSIDLLNSVRFTNYIKNTIRVENEWLTGECDIITEDSIIDVKTPWSLETFPAFIEDAYNSHYEWQMRAYMMLYDKSSSEVIHCMVTTSNELLNEWENLSIHRVDHIDPEKRITALYFERNEEVENQIIERLKKSTEIYNEYYSLLNEK